MIIVEGCDNSGKTTLIKQLCEKFPELRMEKAPHPATLGEKLAWISKAILEEDPRIIYDRFPPISERVYGPLLRNGDVFGAYTFDLLRLTFKREPLVIYCRPPLVSIRGWKGRDQMAGVKEHVNEIVARYDWLVGVMLELYPSGRILNYDYTLWHSLNDILGAVQLYLSSHKHYLHAMKKMGGAQ